MSTRSRLPILLAIAVLVAGCAGQVGVSPQGSRPVRSAPPLQTLPPSGEPVTGEVPAEIIERIVADAEERTGAAADDIEVLQAMQMTFSDGSLDCPEPGMFYTQALVDGYHVILDAAGEELDYRVTADGGFRLCEDPGTPAGG